MKSLRLVISSVAVALLTSCGGGGGGSATVPVVGYVVDAPVEGLSYTCGGLLGTTGSDGSFLHDTGSACTFKIGNVTVGEFNAAPSDRIVTPHDLAGVSRSDPLNSSAVAIAQFLQSLDDGSGTGKIKIPSSVETALSAVPAQKIVEAKPQTQNQLSALVLTATSNKKTLVSAATAAATMNTFIQTAYPNLDTSKGAVPPSAPTSTATANPPVLTTSLPATLTATGITTGFTATSDMDATGYFVILPAKSKAPNKWQIISGADADNKAVSLSGSVSMTGGVAVSKTVTGLAFDTAYKVYFVLTNAKQPSKASEVASSSVTTAPEPTVPVLSGTIPTSLTQSNHATSFSVTPDVTSTGYWVVLPNTNSEPTPAQIVAGLDASGNAFSLKGNAAMAGGTAKTFTLSGMAYGETYKVYFVAVNASDSTKVTNVISRTINVEYELPNPTLTNASENLAPFYPGNSVFLLPKFAFGSGKITWVDSAGKTQTLIIGSSGTLVQVNPLVTTTFRLTIAYQDPYSVQPSIKTLTKDLTVTVTPSFSTVTSIDQAGDMSVERADHAAVVLPDGKVLVTGGTDGSNVLQSSEIFDPSTEKWTVTGSMKTARRGHTITLLDNNKVLVTGGYDGKEALNSAETFDINTGSWTSTIGSMKNTRRFHSSVLLSDGKVLILGGNVGPLLTANPKATELYNPATGLFVAYSTFNESSVGSGVGTGLALPEARFGHTATRFSNDKILLVGNSGEGTAAAKLLTYNSNNPELSTWSLAGTMIVTRYNHSAVGLSDNSILVSGGYGTSSKSAEIYSPSTNTWTAAANMSVSRSMHTSTLLPNGRVLVVGGFDGAKALNTLEIYKPSTNTWISTTDSKVLNLPRAMHSSLLLSSGDVLIFGTNYQSSGSTSKLTEIWRN